MSSHIYDNSCFGEQFAAMLKIISFHGGKMSFTRLKCLFLALQYKVIAKYGFIIGKDEQLKLVDNEFYFLSLLDPKREEKSIILKELFGIDGSVVFLKDGAKNWLRSEDYNDVRAVSGNLCDAVLKQMTFVCMENKYETDEELCKKVNALFPVHKKQWFSWIDIINQCEEWEKSIPFVRSHLLEDIGLSYSISKFLQGNSDELENTKANIDKINELN